MKILRLSFLTFLIISLFSSSQLLAQLNENDSSFYHAAINNAKELYRQSEKSQTRLLNGRKYIPYRIAFIGGGTPFFQTDEFVDGSIVYEDNFYDSVKLVYDQVDERVVFRSEFAIELIAERVKQFSISGHYFTRLQNDSVNSIIKTGFYEKLYSGSIELYKKEMKKIKENLSSTDGIMGEIELKTNYYIKRDGHFYLIKKNNSLFEALGGYKKEMQQFMKANGLKLKRNKDYTLLKIASYFEQLTR
ncbi:hypothetical protein BH11BAC3_BH11BAC3_00210 [soil metagenome]